MRGVKRNMTNAKLLKRAKANGTLTEKLDEVLRWSLASATAPLRGEDYFSRAVALGDDRPRQWNYSFCVQGRRPGLLKNLELQIGANLSAKAKSFVASLFGESYRGLAPAYA